MYKVKEKNVKRLIEYLKKNNTQTDRNKKSKKYSQTKKVYK